MKKNKFILASVAALMAVSPLAALGSQIHTVQAADNSIKKTVMHNSIAYDKNGNSTGAKYYAYNKINVDQSLITIKGNLYYKITGKNQYLKITNIDGVTRRLTHNAYVYSSSTRRTSHNGSWVLTKGQVITTYGGSYKFRNGKSYFRVGGPNKQYIRTSNVGNVINTNYNPTNRDTTNNSQSTTSAQETTVTVTISNTTLYTVKDGYEAVQPTNKRVKKGTTFTVDRLEQGTRADTGTDGDDDNELAIYHIKGTNYWIYNTAVKAAKQLPVQQYYKTNTSMITMSKPVEVYNADGTSQNIIIKKNDMTWGVKNLSYIWVAKDNKAELFYRLSLNGQYRSVYRITSDGSRISDRLPIKDAYVKASDVEIDPDSIALTPSNTPAEAEAAARK